MNLKETAQRLNINTRAVLLLIHSGQLKATRHWFRGWTVTTSDIIDYRLNQYHRNRRLSGIEPTEQDVNIHMARAVVAWAKAAGVTPTSEELDTASKLTTAEQVTSIDVDRVTPADVYAARAIIKTAERLGEPVDDWTVQVAALDPLSLTRLEDRDEA